MSKWSWFLALYLLGLTIASFYSVYLMDQSKGLFDGRVSMVGGDSSTSDLSKAVSQTGSAASGINTSGITAGGLLGSVRQGFTSGGLLDRVRDAVTFSKNLTYAIIIGNAGVIIALILFDFKITARNSV